jgi:hypothetical protein
MVAFALPTATNQLRRKGGEAYGSLYAGKTTLSEHERINLVNEWEYLRRHLTPNVLALGLGVISLPGGEEMLPQALGDSEMATQVAQIAANAQRNPFMFMQNPQLRMFVQALEEGYEIVGHLGDNDDMFPLLVAEARANGVTVNMDLLNTLLERRGLTADTDEYDSMRQSLHDLLLVMNSFKLAADSVKISAPVRQHSLAARLQEMSVNLVEFNAKDYLNQVGEPTPAQIQAHFDKYKDTLAEGSPSGFGYKYPNRVKFDVVILDREQVKKAVGEIDLVDIIEYYERNRNKPEMILTTQPATKPSSEFTLSNLPGPATKPTTRPKTLEEAQPQIRTTLADQRINELTTKVRDAVRNTMIGDYNAWKAAQVSAGAGGGKPGTSQPAPASSLGPQFNSFEYLKALRDKVQKDHNVTLTIEQRDQWQSADSLKDTELAKLSWEPQVGMQPIDLPRMLTMRLEAFVSEDDRRRMSGARVLGMWEPTPIFTNELQSQAVIARATAAEASHSPKSPDEIREKLVADTKLALAYEKAKQAAQALVEASRSGKWLADVAAAQNRKVITTGEFSPMPMSFFGDLPVQGYEGLKGPGVRTFKTEAFKLLSQAARSGGTAVRTVLPVTPASQPATQPTTKPTTLAATNPATRPTTLAAATQPARPATTQATFAQHPVGLVEIPAEGKVLAVEVNSLKAGQGWTKESQPQVERQILVQQKISEEAQLKLQWFDYDNLIKRTQFKPQEQRDRSNKRRALPPVDNPFVGSGMP